VTRVLVVDNYDSFVFNLVQYLGQLGVALAVDARHLGGQGLELGQLLPQVAVVGGDEVVGQLGRRELGPGDVAAGRHVRETLQQRDRTCPFLRFPIVEQVDDDVRVDERQLRSYRHRS